MTDEPRALIRSDARDNRDRILLAARAAFAAGGVDAPLREIARRAGVGIATLYRHFPTKERLVKATFATDLGRCTELIQEGLAEDDAAAGLAHTVHGLMAMRALDRGLAATFSKHTDHGRTAARADRTRALHLLDQLVTRARAAGSFRQDLSTDDLVLALMANEGIRAATLDLRIRASQRFATLILAGLQAR